MYLPAAAAHKESSVFNGASPVTELAALSTVSTDGISAAGSTGSLGSTLFEGYTWQQQSMTKYSKLSQLSHSVLLYLISLLFKSHLRLGQVHKRI